jgi:hypothetical protein
MKSRASLLLLILLVLIAVSGIWYFHVLPKLQPASIFPATVSRDCAPTDGSAFTVRISLDNSDLIDISIWQSPNIPLAVTFFFPDNTARIGNAILIHPIGLPNVLSGKVRFQRVDQNQNVAGEFDLFDEFGNQFRGRFEAEWDHRIALCG